MLERRLDRLVHFRGVREVRCDRAADSSPGDVTSIALSDAVTLTWLDTARTAIDATVEQAPNAPVEPGLTPVGDTIRLDSDSQVPPFELEFEIGQPPNPDAIPVVGFSDGATWTYLEPDWDSAGGTVSVEADHFSWWSVFWVDVPRMVKDTITQELGFIDQTPIGCTTTLPTGWSVAIEGGNGADLSTCASLEGTTLTIEIKNQRRASFIVTLPDDWEGTLDELAPLSDTISGWLFNSFGNNALVIPGGATGVITIPNIQGTGNTARVPVDQDMFSWAIDGLLTAGAVYAGGATGSQRSVLEALGTGDQTRGILDCIGKTREFADALTVETISPETLEDFLPAALSCARSLLVEGTLAHAINMIVGTISSVIVTTWSLLEMTIDIATLSATRQLAITSASLVPPTTSAPTRLTSCEGTDLSDVEGDIVTTVCSYPWALAETTTTLGGGPAVIVTLLNTDTRSLVTAWYEVEDGPTVSGYSAAAIAAAGVPADVAVLLYDSLDACPGC